MGIGFGGGWSRGVLEESEGDEVGEGGESTEGAEDGDGGESGVKRRKLKAIARAQEQKEERAGVVSEVQMMVDAGEELNVEVDMGWRAMDVDKVLVGGEVIAVGLEAEVRRGLVCR